MKQTAFTFSLHLLNFCWNILIITDYLCVPVLYGKCCKLLTVALIVTFDNLKSIKLNNYISRCVIAMLSGLF